ncbi:hypothetical protein HUG17_9463 [Dermatophagoides farinae]|uniref:C2H2-type domain-containing protein n=1 Tax=Dermatophagoides farinae TaxID=6954 RepID=A0A9D4NUH1_DERFA|nr:hypothetical protein HUG17_9463 [Dermatophagoides farinae]
MSSTKIKSDNLINTPFNAKAECLRNRRNYTRHLSREELDKRFPKQKCLFEECGSQLSTVDSLIKHLNNKHESYCQKLLDGHYDQAMAELPVEVVIRFNQQRRGQNVSGQHDDAMIEQPDEVIAGRHHQPIVEEIGQNVAGQHDDAMIEQPDEVIAGQHHQPIVEEIGQNITSQHDQSMETGYDVAGPSYRESTIAETSENVSDDNQMEVDPVDDNDSESDDNDNEFDELDKLFEKLSLPKSKPGHQAFYNSKVSPLCQGEREFLKQFIVELSEVRLKKSIPNAHVEELGSVIAKNFQKAQEFPNHIMDIMARYSSSCYLQDQFFEMQPNYVQPIKIPTSDPELTIQYYSVEGILRSIMSQHPSLINIIEKEKRLQFVPENERKNFTINNELDTTDKTMFERLKGKLRVEIFLDDYSFMGKRGRKFLAGYLSCSNLPFQERVQRDQINVFLLVKRPITKVKNSMNMILKPLVREMQQLEHSGIKVKKDNGEIVEIQVILSKIICDNLAQNEILGFSMGFGKSSICRECLTKREKYPSSRLHSILDSDEHNLVKSGVKNLVFRDCILTDLRGVTLSNISPPDMFHDLFEGPIIKIMNLFFWTLINSKKNNLKLTTKIIAKRLESFPLYNGKILVEFEKKKFLKINGNGVQKFECFMRLSEIFFDEFEKICDNEIDILQFYEHTVSFCRLARQTEFNSNDLKDLDMFSKSIIDSFVHISNQHEYMKFNVTYKLHKLLHYSNNIKRYESVHQISKRYGSSMGCWKSPADTLSGRIALRQTLPSFGKEVSKEGWIKQTTVEDKFWNKETNRFKIIFVQSYYGLRSKIGSEINEDRLKNDHGNDAEHYKFIGGYLVTNMVQCPMKHHVHHQVTLEFRYQSMILTLTFLKGLHWIELSEQLIRFVPEILQSSN